MEASLIGASAITSLALAVLIARVPERLVRPSTLLLLVMHVRLQWPIAFAMGQARAMLERPLHVAILVHGFMLVGVFLTALRGPATRREQKLWQSARSAASGTEIGGARRQLRWLVPAMLVVSLLYFAVVPVSGTGLYTLLTDPASLGSAREHSLKLVPVPGLRYLYSWQINTLSPMLLAIAAALWRYGRRSSQHQVFALMLGVFAAVSMGITGSRSGLALVPVVLLLAAGVLDSRQLRRLIPIFLLGAGLVVISTAYISLVREGREVTTANTIEYSQEIALGRIFSTPTKTGMWYMQYADRNGPTGIQSIRPLARYYGQEHRLLARDIGQMYVSPTSESVLTNTNFLFAYYAAFGLWSVPLSLAALIALDLLLVPMARAPSALALPFLAALVVKAVLLSEGVFTTSLVTGGYLLIPVLAWAGQLTSKRVVWR